MQIFKIDVPQEVLDEIEYYVDVIAQDSVQSAVKWYIDIKQRIETLDQSPARCPYADENIFHDYEIRNLIFGDYRILFRIEDKTVQILHVKHGKMRRRPLN